MTSEPTERMGFSVEGEDRGPPAGKPEVGRVSHVDEDAAVDETEEVSPPGSGAMLWRGSVVAREMLGYSSDGPLVWRGTPVDDTRPLTAEASRMLVWRGSSVEGSGTAAHPSGDRLWRGSFVADRIWIDDDGLLHRGERWIALPDLEWRLLGLLVDRFGDLVSRAELAAAGWGPDADAGPRLTHRIAKARKRVAPLDLRVTGLPNRGYFMESAS